VSLLERLWIVNACHQVQSADFRKAMTALKRLMFAMLVDAARCFQTKCEARPSAKRQEWAEVRSWIFSEEDNGMFSFTAVCDSLQIDPRLIRQWLRRWAGTTPGW
jgi:hypothetical protein